MVGLKVYGSQGGHHSVGAGSTLAIASNKGTISDWAE